MSYTEFHKGKFKIIAKGDEAIINYMAANHLEDKFCLTIKDSRIIEHDCYGCNAGDYAILTVNRLKPNETLVLIQYVDHYWCDVSEEYLDEFRQVSQNEFEFVSQFYNGGCCESEILEDHLAKIDLNVPCEPIGTIELSARESHMIMDILQLWAGGESGDIDWSTKEIADLVLRLDELNHKNNW